MAGKRQPKKGSKVTTVPHGDETFAYIVGYTPGGVPFGITREEDETLETSDSEKDLRYDPLSQAPHLPQAKPVPLNDLIGEMQIQSEEWTVYYRRSTGEFIGLKDEYIEVAKDGDWLTHRPEWERAEVERTAEVLKNIHEPDFVPLPSKYEIHEYSIIEEFCHTAQNPRIANDLFRSISGKGAFRRFKEAINRHSLLEEWYRFKDESFKALAREWCRDNNLTWHE